MSDTFYDVILHHQIHILTVSFTSSGTRVKNIESHERALRCLHKVKQEVDRTLTCQYKVVRKKN